jgi:carboxylate-amine ligase
VDELLAGYPRTGRDEALDGAGRLRPGHAALAAALGRLEAPGLAVAAAALAEEAARRGIALSSWADGRQLRRTLPLDPVPRLVPAGDWARVAAGVEQRHRALGAFLADVYRAAGRRRGDPDRAPEVVRAGVLPEWAVAHHPRHNPDAVGMAWRGQQRSAVAATDVVRTGDGAWLAAGDDLRVPAGLGYALAVRDTVRSAVPGLDDGVPVADPRAAVPLLRAALLAAAPPACTDEPVAAVLSAGEVDGAWFEHGLLAAALGVPVVRAAELWPRADGGIEAAVGGGRIALDVLYRRFDDAELAAHRTAVGQPLSALLGEAVRAGRLGLVNVPGNGIADDAATYAWVPQMVRFYLGEEPLLGSVRTWVLADDAQWAQVRDRLHELVLVPVDGYGGGGVVHGPRSSAAELAQLQAEVAAAPHRFVAREPVEVSTVPTVADGRLVPRPVELRVFSATAERTTALPAPLTLIAPGERSAGWHRGTAAQDTWLLQTPLSR